MKITVARSAGFCFGVKRALEIAYEAVKIGGNIEMIGDIVHNEEAVKQISRTGIKKVRFLRKGKDKILLIRAHGVAKSVIRKASSLGYKIIDATCPMVKEIHKIASEMEKKGYKIIIIGDKLHDEVIGIMGQLKNKAIVIDAAKKIPDKKISRIKKAAVVVQSTQDIEKVLKIIGILKKQVRDLKFFNTICIPTRLKQQEIKKISRENSLIIIIGSKTSANTKRLYQIAKSLNPKTYWIQNKSELRFAWFKGKKKIGITAGSSTPEKITQEIIEYLRKIN